MLICDQKNADLFSQCDDSQISVYTTALFEKDSKLTPLHVIFHKPGRLQHEITGSLSFHLWSENKAGQSM